MSKKHAAGGGSASAIKYRRMLGIRRGYEEEFDHMSKAYDDLARAKGDLAEAGHAGDLDAIELADEVVRRQKKVEAADAAFDKAKLHAEGHNKRKYAATTRVSETAGMTPRQVRDYLENKRDAERAAQAYEAGLRFRAEEMARKGNPVLGLKFEEGTSRWSAAVSSYMEVFRKKDKAEAERAPPAASAPVEALPAAAAAAVAPTAWVASKPLYDKKFTAEDDAV